MDSSWPKISIVTPSFNQGRFLEKTILSVLNQNYPNLEYMIMDGGSTDQSLQVIRKYERYLAHWVSEKDGGQAWAIRNGFQRCTGEIFAYLNSDDVYLPGTLMRVALTYRARPRADVVYGNKYLTDESDRIIGERRLTPYIPCISKFAFLYGGFGIYQPASFWRRSIYEKVGGIDSAFIHCMDNDLFTKFAMHNGEFAFVREYFAASRIHRDSKTSTLRQVAKREGDAVKARYPHSQNRLFGLAYLTLVRTIRTMFHIVQGDSMYLIRRTSGDVAWVP